jgi:hydrogenase expression/formation protein HypC
MRTLEAWSGQALVEGRGRVETIDTRLVGDCAAGDWLLVFQGAAREKLDAERAAEIDAALDLLEAGLSGDVLGAGADPGFALPSAMSAQQLAELTGAASAPGTSSGSTVHTGDHTNWLHALAGKPAPT